jgi:hypothetical protein
MIPLFDKLCVAQVYSLDYARTRLANDAADGHHNRQFTGLLSVYKKTYATDGIAGLYRGFNVSVVSMLSVDLGVSVGVGGCACLCCLTCAQECVTRQACFVHVQLTSIRGSNGRGNECY